MIPERFDFEADRLTVAEIHERVPALAPKTIRKYLRDGMTTRSEMLAVDPRQAFRRGGRRSARGRNWNQSPLGAHR